MSNEQMDSSTSSGASMALRTWELANSIGPIETIYHYDANEQQAIRAVKPWEKDPHYFKVSNFDDFFPKRKL